MEEALLELMAATVEQCALVVEEIPSSASLYESRRSAEVVNEFKKRAAMEIRALMKPL